MRILTIDVGTGTQDILFFDSELELENCPQLVMPSPTVVVAKAIEEATKKGSPVVLVGPIMGGGPCAWALESHLRAGLPAYATPEAAQTVNDDLEEVARMGIVLVDEAEATSGRLGLVVRTGDVRLESIIQALVSMGVDATFDAAAVAVFDHGAAPPGVSDRKFRFEYLRQRLALGDDLCVFAFQRQDIPASMTRLRAAAYALPGDIPVLAMDTGPAAVLGALEDLVVASARHRLVVNVGNFHTLAFHMEDGRVLGLMEHHTGLLTGSKLESYLVRLVSGRVTDEEVFADMGHGALVRGASESFPELVAVTGPRRRIMWETGLSPYFAVPHGHMMLAGCYGLLRAFTRAFPELSEIVDSRLSPGPR
jgi:uncharacterized protein (DUF1786 family)